EGDGDRGQSREKHVTPGSLRLACEPDAGDLVVQQAGEGDADRRGGVHDDGGLDAAILRHGLGYQGRADGELSADAEAGDEAEAHELPDVRGESAQGRPE